MYRKWKNVSNNISKGIRFNFEKLRKHLNLEKYNHKRNISCYNICLLEASNSFLKHFFVSSKATRYCFVTKLLRCIMWICFILFMLYIFTNSTEEAELEERSILPIKNYNFGYFIYFCTLYVRWISRDRCRRNTWVLLAIYIY